MSDVWTFEGISFTWLRQERNGVPVLPGWDSQPREVVRPHLGSRNANTATIGYTPTVITGPIYVESDADAAALKALSGTAGSISDGTTTWTARGRITLFALAPGGAGWTGEATFTRGQG